MEVRKTNINQINRLIKEEVQKYLFESSTFWGPGVEEGLDEYKKKKKKKKKHRKYSERKNDKRASFTTSGDRQYVMNAFKNKGLDLAQYAYRLYPDMDKDTARSKFYKKLNNDKVEDGYSDDRDYHYSFDDDEVATLIDLLDNKL